MLESWQSMLDAVVASAARVQGARAKHSETELSVRCPRCDAGVDVPCRRGVPCVGREAFAVQEAQRSAREAEAERQRRTARLLAQADVPNHLAERVVTLGAAARQTEALLSFQEWRESDALSLILCGARGVGKSFAAGRAVELGPRRRVVGERALWVLGAELGNLGPNDSQLHRLRRCGLLVIDDLGGGDVLPARMRERLDSVWAVRVDRGLDTLATTNLAAPEVQGLLDERLRDRLRAPLGRVDGLKERTSLRSGREG